jgi:hypothetical protein
MFGRSANGSILVPHINLKLRRLATSARIAFSRHPLAANATVDSHLSINLTTIDRHLLHFSHCAEKSKNSLSSSSQMADGLSGLTAVTTTESGAVFLTSLRISASCVASPTVSIQDSSFNLSRSSCLINWAGLPSRREIS